MVMIDGRSSMKSVMVEEIVVVNRLNDLHVVVTHILPEASSIVEVRLNRNQAELVLCVS